jgi:hypothetical protein
MVASFDFQAPMMRTRDIEDTLHLQVAKRFIFGITMNIDLNNSDKERIRRSCSIRHFYSSGYKCN